VTSDPSLPSTARVVVIGGGVGGVSVAYHLAERGERDVVLLDRSELTSGSTFHSAGLVGQLRADPTLTRMNMYSVELYRRLQAGDHPPGWTESGSIKLASTPQRLEEIRRQISWAKVVGLPLVEISPSEAAERFPLMDPAGVVGACYLPSDGSLDPSQLCHALAAGARAGGVRIRTHTRVIGIDTRPDPRAGGRRSVTRVRTDAGDIDCEVVIDCGGIYAAQIARLVGVRVPVVPMSHQYLITAPLLDGSRPENGSQLPSLRDPDLLVYYRQEVDGLLMGGYERDPAPWTATATSFDDIPADFNGKLLAEDWDRFEEITANSQLRVPAMADVPIRKLVNGPEAFTPDNEFCLGETEVAGFFVAAGFCAHGIAGAGGIGQVMAEWILDGRPSLDVWHMDVRRFGDAYRSPSYTMARTLENYRTYYDIAYPGRERERESGRPLRTSPAYPWHAAHGAEFGEKAGWERVNHYESNADPELEPLRPAGWAGRSWSTAIAVEHLATRQAAGLFDESSFAKISISGPDAAPFLERVCDNRVARGIGDVTYTQLLNGAGGIEADVTVTRTGEQEFLLVTGTAYGSHDLGWLRSQAAATDAAATDAAATDAVATDAADADAGLDAGFDVRIEDVTGSLVTYALWGPRSREILAGLTPADLSDPAFGFMTSQQITVGDVPVRALRVTFVGELGWELYASAEYGAGLWSTLWQAGRPAGMRACGYRAIESLRLEKGYRVWSSDITPETTPYEAGLGFCVKLDKAGGFVGDGALRAAKAAGRTRVLSCITLHDPRRVVLGGEPVRVGQLPVGRVTSGGFGYSVERSIAYAYLPVELAAPGTPVEVDLFGDWVTGCVASAPLLDPSGVRVRG
jgi:glycine cleavage system aminomethyltransferase T/glycine/D-amino acid oxidase-like deaminating enzyme